ncbi:hypothetical protein Daesc_001366 [Daldinia eschscholtzii]|uniref:Uncharacterized protein n=1 Tax=Daldinia eschscholtzii TaxID=292717 RepID=A0AAX6MU98_9PEZI
MSASSTTLVITTAATDPSFARRQVTLTQTITYPDATSTALVTLDRGAPPTDSPAPTWSAGAASSDGLGQQQIGIIVGCGCKPYSVYHEGDHDVIYFSDDMEEVARPERSYWPRFPRSISPPIVPTYVATDTGPQWTAYEASGRYYPTYYGS